MAAMTVRTTVAFDPATASRLERLAKRWGVSKSETLRRALEAAEQNLVAGNSSIVQPEITEETITRMSPLEAFEWLQANLFGNFGS
ncbi:MAG TPA: ribbon-helix-helix protein, CopG family, partial [Chthoniobacterales bacterium]